MLLMQQLNPKSESVKSNLPNNNPLHDAIVENRTEDALYLIKNDEKGELINAESLGNTPLLLALKKGNKTVAEALLQRDGINVNAKDCRGLTALHWACILRLNQIITMLLDKHADPHYETPRWIEGLGKKPMNPLYLYKDNIEVLAFESFSLMPECKFVDHKYLAIPGYLAYTDVIFHIDDICINMKWVTDKTKFVKLGDSYDGIKMLSTNQVFKRNFCIGYSIFCKFRNDMPIDNTLIDRMLNTSKQMQPSVRP